MALVIYNPTNEILTATYIGETCEIAPEQKLKMDDARARHLLNNLGARGLVTLEYGDQGDGEEKKAKEGRTRNREFKRQQVLRYNQMNESHKQQGLPYVVIPEQVQEYAKELGLVLVQPYQYKDKEVEEISQLRETRDDQFRYIKKLEDTNKENQDQIAALSSKVADLITIMQGGTVPPAVDPEQSAEAYKVDLDRVRSELGYVRLPNTHFENWVARRWDDVQAAPPEIQEEIMERYARITNKPFPESRPEVQENAA